jgi:hypothetical protein
MQQYEFVHFTVQNVQSTAHTLHLFCFLTPAELDMTSKVQDNLSLSGRRSFNASRVGMGHRAALTLATPVLRGASCRAGQDITSTVCSDANRAGQRHTSPSGHQLFATRPLAKMENSPRAACSSNTGLLGSAACSLLSARDPPLSDQPARSPAESAAGRLVPVSASSDRRECCIAAFQADACHAS